MNDVEIDALLTKACSTDRGKLKASFVLHDLNKLAPVFADPGTRPQAEQALEAMSACADPLRKSLAMAWLARARGSIAGGAAAAVKGLGAATGVTAATQAVGRGYQRAAGAAGDLGAAAGAKLAHSPLNAKRMAAAKQAGGEAARSRMAERLAPGRGPGPRGPHLGPPIPGRATLESAPSPRMTAPAAGTTFTGPGGTHSSAGVLNLMREGHEPPAGGWARPGFVEPAPPSFQSQRGPAPLPVADRVAAVHADALASAYKSGAASAAASHAHAAAKMGRVVARHSFKAGMQLGGAATAVAAAGTVGGALSEAQHKERVDAARAPRHRGGVAQ